MPDFVDTKEICTYDGVFQGFSAENHIDLATGKSYELNVITDDLLTYIIGIEPGRTSLQSKEVTHMVDVYNLYDKGTGIRNVALVIIGLALRFIYGSLAMFSVGQSIVKGFVWIWGVIGVFGLLILMDLQIFYYVSRSLF